MDKAKESAILSIISIFLKNMNEITYPGRNKTYGVPKVILKDSRNVKFVRVSIIVTSANIPIVIGSLFFIF